MGFCIFDALGVGPAGIPTTCTRQQQEEKLLVFIAHPSQDYHHMLTKYLVLDPRTAVLLPPYMT